MSVRAKGAVALLLLGYFGACWYFDALDRCFESGGGWRKFSGCYGAGEVGDPPEADPFRTPGDTDSAGRASSVGTGLLRESHRAQVVVRLVDSTHWRVEEGLDMEGDLWRIEIAQNGRLDTIPSIQVRELPVFESDSVVTGLSYVEGDLQSGYRYAVGRRQVDTIPLVDAIRREWITPDLSPGGRLVAYWRLTGDGEGRIEIAEWPSQQVVGGGPRQAVGAGDASPGMARWIASDTLEYVIWAEEGRVLKGRWSPTGFSVVDTTLAD
jgi:hypothetical protein